MTKNIGQIIVDTVDRLNPKKSKTGIIVSATGALKVRIDGRVQPAVNSSGTILQPGDVVYVARHLKEWDVLGVLKRGQSNQQTTSSSDGGFIRPVAKTPSTIDTYAFTTGHVGETVVISDSLEFHTIGSRALLLVHMSFSFTDASTNARGVMRAVCDDAVYGPNLTVTLAPNSANRPVVHAYSAILTDLTPGQHSVEMEFDVTILNIGTITASAPIITAVEI